MSSEIYPVVHIEFMAKAATQAAAAIELGADGVYLIDHSSRNENLLLDTFDSVAKWYPDSFIGVNFLCLPDSYVAFSSLKKAIDSQSIRRLPDGLWVDDAGRRKEETVQLRLAEPALTAIRYLGGAAFKYTDHYTDEPQEAAAQAAGMEPYVDVVTTSGQGTGQAADLQKIKAMKEAMTKPLAIASGVNADNVGDYAGWADQILVASSVETALGSGVFDQMKLRDLIQTVHEM